MKPILTAVKWLALSVAFLCFAPAAHAQNRSVKLTVNVLSAKQEPAPGASVTLRPSTGGPAIHKETGADGSVTADVSLGSPGGWFSSEPTINISVERESEKGSSTVNIRTNEFKGTSTIEVVRTVTLSPPPAPLSASTDVRLNVHVTNEEGHPVGGAMVSITHDSFGPEFRSHDYRIESNGQGIATAVIEIGQRGKTDWWNVGKRGEGWLYWPTLNVAVNKGDKNATATVKIEGTRFTGGVRYPEYVDTTVVLNGDQSTRRETITVQVPVQDDTGPVEGASVLIFDSTLGPSSGRSPGVTGADGQATIPVWWTIAGTEGSFELTVSKNGYKDKRTFIKLNAKQVDQTVPVPAVILEKVATRGAKVTVTVRSKKNKSLVGDAEVIFDNGSGGYYSDTTGGAGVAKFMVAEIGNFDVRISQDEYLPLTAQTRFLEGEKEKELRYELEPKTVKDQGEDTIEVTVYGKETTEKESKKNKLAGASARAGSITAYSDENGIATLVGAFEEKQEVFVQANGYKPVTKTVGISKLLHMSKGSAKTTFTLDPELSNESPIRLTIDVRGPGAKGEMAPVANAEVKFILPGGRSVPARPTDANGSTEFVSSSVADVPLSELRKGLVVSVKATGYKEVPDRTVPADMLEPSTKTKEFVVQLDRDWSELEKELTALEEKIKAWNNERGNVPKNVEDEFINKALGARKHAEQVEKEIEAAKETFGINLSPGGPIISKTCQDAKKLKEDIQLCEAEANQKAEEMKRLLDAASATAEQCSGDKDPDNIRASYKDSIKLLAEIGKRNKKAVKDRDELAPMVTGIKAAAKLLPELDAKLAAIGEDLKTAQDAAKKAADQYGRVGESAKGSQAKRVELYRDFATVKDKYNVANVEPPSAIQTQIDRIENALNPRDVVGDSQTKTKTVPQSVTEAPQMIAKSQANAERFIARYRSQSCEIDTMDEMVDGVDKTFTNATFEIGLAADLPMKAEECAKKLAGAADEVEVPNIETLNDLGAMTRAADQVGMKFHAAATSATPPPGSQRLFGPQDPPAKSKAKRGDALTILVYQKLAEKKATPTPTPVVVASATPSPTVAGEEYVDVPSVAGAADAGAMSKMLSAAGYKAVFNAATPKKKEDELKFAGQDPVGKVKKSDMVARNNQVTVSINQKWQDLESPTPTPPGTKSGRMPSLIGLTVDEASGRLTGNQRIGSVEMGRKPPAPDKALTIYYQYPAADQPVADNVVVKIIAYGDVDGSTSSTGTGTTSTSPTPRESPTVSGTGGTSGSSTSSTSVARFDGTYHGSYSGMAHVGGGNYKQNGSVTFIVSGGSVRITKPGSGSGNVSADGSATFGGGSHDGTAYNFRGSFSSSSGGAKASGSWSATFDGGNASGRWSASK